MQPIEVLEQGGHWAEHLLFRSDRVNQTQELMRRLSINWDGSISIIILTISPNAHIAWGFILIWLGLNLTPISP